MISQLNASNVCEYANISVTANAAKLREHCVCFMIDSVRQIKYLDNSDTLCDEITKEVGQRTLCFTVDTV